MHSDARRTAVGSHETGREPHDEPGSALLPLLLALACAAGFVIIVPILDYEYNGYRDGDYFPLGAALAVGAVLVLFRTHWCTYIAVLAAAFGAAVLGEIDTLALIGRGAYDPALRSFTTPNFPAAYAVYLCICLAFAAVLGGAAVVISGPLKRRRADRRSAAAAQARVQAPRPVVVGHTATGEPVYANQAAPPTSASTNTMAILALCFGVMGGVLGIVFGHIALSQIKRTGEQGRGMAIAGLVLGYIALAVTIAWFVFMAIFLNSY